MKKTYLHFILSCVVLLGLFTFVSCSDNDNEEVETTIDYNALPETAQTFLTCYFGGKSNVLKIQETFTENMTLYEVTTDDGFSVVFNSSGYWQQINSTGEKTIPSAVIPEQIQQTLSEKYYGYGVKEINTEGQNYHLVLSNNQGGDSIELIFNQSGEILSDSSM